MMKLVIVLGLVLSLVSLGGQPCFAEYRTNVSPVTVALANQTASRSIVFPFTTRDLIIQNNDTTHYVWVDLKSSTNGAGFPLNTADITKCVLLVPSQELLLYDFLTDGITISGTNAKYGPTGGASPIIVEAIF